MHPNCPALPALPALARQIVGAGLSRPNDRRRKAAPTRTSRPALALMPTIVHKLVNAGLGQGLGQGRILHICVLVPTLCVGMGCTGALRRVRKPYC